MFTRERVPMVYSRAELVSDAAVHVIGIVAALIAVPVLVTLAAVWFGDPTTVVAAVVYGLSLIAMFALLGGLQPDAAAGLEGPAAPHRPVGDLRQDRRQLHAVRGADRHPRRPLPRRRLGHGAGRRLADPASARRR